MTTLRTRTVVSLAATMIAALSLGACVRAPSRPAAGDGAAFEEPRRLAFRFDNEALDPVEVYLVVDQREWRLGRVAPGARADLRIPEASFAGRPSFVQIAVVRGAGRAPLATLAGRATVSMPQTMPSILSQRWLFADGQVRSLQLRSQRQDAGRP